MKFGKTPIKNDLEVDTDRRWPFLGHLAYRSTEEKKRIQTFISCPLESWVLLWNFEIIRGTLMRPKWAKLVSLAQKICTL